MIAWTMIPSLWQMTPRIDLIPRCIIRLANSPEIAHKSPWSGTIDAFLRLFCNGMFDLLKVDNHHSFAIHPHKVVQFVIPVLDPV